MSSENPEALFRCRTPVAFLIFNRPETTARVFERIAAARPPRLLVVPDGPREGVPGEKERCEEALSITKQVDWDCQILTDFSPVNLGCKGRVSSGLSWVFSQVEEAIILEDDCLPHPSFFRFCDELLNLYRHEERVAPIGGVNFQPPRRLTPASFYFSRYAHIWGWAAWRRSWMHYDVGISRWPELKRSGWLESFLGERRQLPYWERMFDAVYEGRLDTWDYQWMFSCWLNHALTALPAANLVSNIGFGFGAAHTRTASRFSNLPPGELRFPLRIPESLERDAEADAFTDRIMFNPPFSRRLKAGIAAGLRRKR